MPLPANVTTVTVRGTFLTPEGEPSTGTVSFTPSSWLLNSGANIAIPNSSVVKTLGTAGDFTALLPTTDDPDLSPGGWVYSVSEVVDGVSQSYNIAIPGTVAAGGTVYLADLAPVAPAGPEYYSLASSLAIGTVSTVATGGSATATITGLAPSQVLNLGIPTGATGTVASAGSGSVGTAAVSPTGDPNTGIYFPAADQVAITTGGTQALLLASGAVSNPTITGVLSVPDGSASAPSITNTGDTNTGLLFPAADTVAVTTNGTERLRVDTNGLITGTGTSLGTWTSYTPTLAGTGWAIGDGTAVGYYTQIGKIVHFRCLITFGATSTYGAGGLTVTLPVTGRSGSSGGYQMFTQLNDTSAGAGYLGASIINNTTTIAVRAVNSAIGIQAAVISSVPFTWATTDSMQLSGTYEAA